MTLFFCCSIVPHRAPLSLTPHQPRHIHDHPPKIARHLSIADDTFSDSDSDVYFDPIEYDDASILHGNTHPSSTVVTPYPTNTIIHVPAPVETINNSVITEMQTSLSSLQEQMRSLQQKITDIQRKFSLPYKEILCHRFENFTPCAGSGFGLRS